MKGGVIVIGSLLWADKLNRPEWRKNNLSLEEKIKVYIPIRYGRLSTSQCNTYTMVFSHECYSLGLGRGWMIPIKNEIHSFTELKTQAKKLGTAEGFRNDYYSSWGAVGLLFNPKKLNDNIIDKWSNFMSDSLVQHSTLNIEKFEKKSAITSRGLLTIDWPKGVDNRGKLDDIDFLLATVTSPKSNFGRYPKPNEIANAMIKADCYDYFRNNRKNGITTFQDKKIERLINR